MRRSGLLTFENYAVMFIGLIALLLGAVLTWKRAKVFEFFADAFGAFGGDSARKAIKGSSPFWIGVVGVSAMGIGFIAILMGIFARE